MTDSLQKWGEIAKITQSVVAILATLVGLIGQWLERTVKKKQKTYPDIIMVVVTRSGQIIVFGVLMGASATGLLTPSVVFLVFLAWFCFQAVSHYLG